MTRDLRALSEHVLYECAMLDDLVQRLGPLAIERDDEATGGPGLENALTEAFVIHVRALIEFLYTDKRKRSDDGIAADLVRDPAEWQQRRGPLPDDLAIVKRRADKEIAHVTFSRKQLSEEARTWGIGPVHASISRVVAEFVPLVPEDRVVADWHKHMWRLLPGFVRGREHFYRPPVVPIISVATTGLPPRP